MPTIRNLLAASAVFNCAKLAISSLTITTSFLSFLTTGPVNPLFHNIAVHEVDNKHIPNTQAFSNKRIFFSSLLLLIPTLPTNSTPSNPIQNTVQTARIFVHISHPTKRNRHYILIMQTSIFIHKSPSNTALFVQTPMLHWWHIAALMNLLLYHHRGRQQKNHSTQVFPPHVPTLKPSTGQTTTMMILNIAAGIK